MSSIEFKLPENTSQPAQPAPEKADLETVRSKLAQTGGRAYWRSLEEVADTEDFQKFLKAEFPTKAEEYDPVNRREFMKLMGASMALAGLTACTKQPPEKIIPYVQQPEDLVPGKPLFYASGIPLKGYGRGILVESHMGRPTKIEGNERHPDSLGSTDAATQAAILNLYDPDRSRTVTGKGRISTWDIFSRRLDKELEGLGPEGEGLSILVGAVSSPSLATLFEGILEKYPKAQLVQYVPADRTLAREGSQLAFGKSVQPVYDFTKADVVLSLDADFLASGPGGIRYARDLMARRDPSSEKYKPSRFYAVESTPTVSGVAADTRLPMRRADMDAFLLALAEKLGARVSGTEAVLNEAAQAVLKAAAEDLSHSKGKSIVLAGDGLSPEAHAAVHAINEALENRGKTIRYIPDMNPLAEVTNGSIQDLAKNMAEGTVKVFINWNSNPVYDAPAELDFAYAIQQVPFRANLGLYQHETAWLCNFHIPETHFLESWSDTTAYDGSYSIIQPLVMPLYKGVHDPYAFFGKIAGQAVKAYDYVKAFWSEKLGEGAETGWQESVHDGVVKLKGPRAERISLKDGLELAPQAAPGDDTYEILFNPDPSIGDGSDANNAWLQELPKPITKLTWDNAALLSPADAAEFHVETGDMLEIKVNGLAVKAPAFIQPGQARGSITLNLGYGRERAGKVGTGIGFNAYAIRTSNTLWTANGASVLATGETYQLVTTQHHHSMEGRNLVRSGTADQYKKNPDFVHDMEHGDLSKNTFYPGYDYSDRNKWGMVINLSNCIGCNACITACQAENNIAVVGKDQVSRGRELLWLRVDRYYKGDLDNPETVTQPIPCMQCENAPCELVCPVGATVHSAEGLNDMVYNRCVGTRYCSNNCPFKVRRFNFYSYTDQSPALKLQRNPDVTVRYKGVMEKCTYCVQRINHARIEAKKSNRPVKDGEVVTACQQACPTDAISFGNLNDKASRVAKMRDSKLNYTLLDELIALPRTSYLAKITNPNSMLASSTAVTESHDVHH